MAWTDGTGVDVSDAAGAHGAMGKDRRRRRRTRTHCVGMVVACSCRQGHGMLMGAVRMWGRVSVGRACIEERRNVSVWAVTHQMGAKTCQGA